MTMPAEPGCLGVALAPTGSRTFTSFGSRLILSAGTALSGYIPALLGIIAETTRDWELIVRQTISVVDQADLGVAYQAETISQAIDQTGVHRWIAFEAKEADLAAPRAGAQLPYRPSRRTRGVPR